MAKNCEADSKENQRLDVTVDSLYVKLGIERDYSMSWEDWHAAGMPDPPGRPRRYNDPSHNKATPPGGSLLSGGRMPNMAVTYQGPNGCLPALTSELTATYGRPARTYEYVTGYKSAANVSGHQRARASR